MSDAAPASRPQGHARTTDGEGFQSLVGLALDMRSVWNHATDKVWRKLDPVLWDLTHSPWVILQTVSRERLNQELGDQAFRKMVDDLVTARREAAEAPAWFQLTHPKSALRSVAYFSMEFMLSEALPIYSGGLGNVAGDQLKAASDLGVPVIGVGLLYQQGYFRQRIDVNGVQQALYPYNDPGQLPITPLRHPNGEWVRMRFDLPGYPLWLRAWQVRIGRVRLYLLDSNDAANYPPYRGITSELYGGGPYTRIMQEMVLGIGGWRLLNMLGIEPDVCHLNEGHAAFAVLERARNFMLASGQPFEVALAATRAGNLFTTHTAVDAGFDRFDPEVIERYLGEYARRELGISLRELLALGRNNPNDPSEKFNMAYLAIRSSGAVNAVSELHGKVSRQLFAPLFPRWPTDEVPIGHVTNGVHTPTWDSAVADDLWTQACGEDRWSGAPDALEEGIRRLPDDTLWRFRNAARAEFVDYARRQLSRQLAASGASPEAVEGARHLFDPHALTLGFARRFATYKRPNLLLHDPDRLRRLLVNPERPVQLIMAGKAHPADQTGQALIQQWTRFVRQPEVRQHAIFLSDYDMHLAERLVQGVDVWLNTPARPWEACGTSGMKVLVNGGLNLSELDGWWAEAFTPAVGWALGDGQEHDHDPAWDAREAEALYELLEHEVIPAFYTRDERNVPVAWTARMRESMALLTPRFSASRAVSEYTERYYLPAASAYRERAGEKGRIAAEIVAWRHAMACKWSGIRLGELRSETRDQSHAFELQVHLNDLDPACVLVELFADTIMGHAAARQEMKRIGQAPGASAGDLYRAAVPADRSPTDYTVRVMPRFGGVAIPLEDRRILWQH